MPDLARLLMPQILGCYTHFEATEVFAEPGRGALPTNVFTLLVAEERTDATIEVPAFLSKKPIKLRGLDWIFGVKRYIRPIADLAGVLATLRIERALLASGKRLQFGELQELAPQFVPPDSFPPVPLNRILKNNFWNGSYVFEWTDRKKGVFDVFYKDSQLLEALGEKIAEILPIEIAALSDRIGNLIVQLPVISLMCKFEPQRTGACNVRIAWHPKVEPRPLTAASQSEFDGVIETYASAAVAAPETLLQGAPAHGLHRGFLWDEQYGIVLAASPPTSFIESFHMGIHVADSEPRTFSFAFPDGTRQIKRVGVNNTRPVVVGNTDADDTGGQTRLRMLREREAELKRDRSFVQYRPNRRPSTELREEGLTDLRQLIAQHGQEGSWLWDPYLGAYDVLETLFYSPHHGADLRALTAAKEAAPSRDSVEKSVSGDPSAKGASTAKQSFVAEQRLILDAVDSNWRGLRLEFRARVGNAGWPFHDRFLIFPQREGAARVWSLGISVNGFGTEHHILQRVDDGELIKNAFLELWDALADPTFLIWKKR